MKLRIALIGGGIMGRQHATFLTQNPDTELVAISDPFNTSLAHELGLPSFADHRQMLDQIAVDGVIVANPNDLHVSTALDCIAAGRPILLEKPVGTSVKEVQALVDAEARTGVAVLIGHHRRHNPITHQAKAIIDSGRLGTISTFTALWQSQKDDAYFDAEWRRRHGAGVLLINLVHDLDLMRHLCGEVATVQAITSNTTRGYEVEDTASLLLQFTNGALGTLTGSDACATPWSWEQSSGENPAFAQQAEQPCYLIGGTLGSLSVPQLHVWTYGSEKGWHVPLDERREAVAPGTALGNQLKHFVQVIRGEAKPLVSAADASRTLALVEAASTAAAQGRLVALTEPEPRSLNR
jgi:predicted dehydrogenase